eukprot:639880-Pyramimonas_sp.AAC.1
MGRAPGAGSRASWACSGDPYQEAPVSPPGRLRGFSGCDGFARGNVAPPHQNMSADGLGAQGWVPRGRLL